ncbi:MAG: cysteine hydrolase [bacterium]|nr:cysteine hydrolase [bacterium]
MTIRELVDPRHTAVLCMEMERGVVGDLARFPGPREVVADEGLVERCATLFAGARRAGIRVIHCTAAFRPDRAGSYRNMPFVSALMDDPLHIPVGSDAASPLAELLDPADLVSERLHGIAPFVNTSLVPYLTSLGVRTVIATGVSLNRGIVGMSIEAVDHGYSVVIPTDAVAGYPADYARLVLKHTLDGLTTLTTVDELVDVWRDAD